MAILFVQDDQGLSDTSILSLGVTWGGNTTTGNLIIVALGAVTFTGPTKNVTDTQGNLYTRIVRRTMSNSFTEIWYAKNITGGTTPTVTATFTGNTRPVMTINEFSGLDTVQPLDLAASSGMSSTTGYTINTPYATRTANELVFVAAHMQTNSSSFSLGSGFSNLQTQSATSTGSGGVESKIVSATGIQTGPITAGSVSTGTLAIVTFADTTMPPFKYDHSLNNYEFVRVGDGMSAGERIR